MRFFRLTSLTVALCFAGVAQTNRITKAVNTDDRVTLSGHVNPRITLGTDQGRVSPDLTIHYVTLTFSLSPAQRADLTQLLSDQQNPKSPQYHQWLTPEEYGARFGLSDADLATVSAWLKGEGLTVDAVARGRSWIAVTGSAAQMETAFRTELHNYLVDGKTHFANAAEPSIPAAFSGVIRSVRGLHNFRMRPASVKGHYTDNTGNYIAPNDLATIYNIAPLLSSGTTGSGQKLVIAGQSQIKLSDIEQFRSTFGLSSNDPDILLVPNTQDPGISQGDESESDLDLEWSGAVARDATILFVYSDDVMTSVQYAIDQNLAPVVSISYGDCEPETPSSDLTAFQSWAQQGNAEGITWFAASGDDGAADCGDSQNPGLSVDAPGSVPEVTDVGGTQFVEGSGNYWSSTNTSSGASALSYIPEAVWNTSVEDGTPAASGGGASTVFSKPSWQVGTGVPNDNARDVPDVAIAASADHDGYFVFTGGQEQVYGGTSVGAPVFSGLTALLNQYLVSKGAQSTPGVGNINPKLYSLAKSNPSVYHDITTGNNTVMIPCGRHSVGCSNPTVGYNAGIGYDQTTGWGSVNALNLFEAWTSSASVSSPAPAIAAVSNGASFKATYAPGMILSVFGTNLASATESASSVPLPDSLASTSVTINGIAAPFYYASATQLNIQVPYEVPVGTTAVLSIDSNGKTTTQAFTVAAAAPGIFTNDGILVPSSSAARGGVVSLYITGAGALSPVVATGSAPSSSTPLSDLPAPTQNTVVTIGGVQAQIEFIGDTAGLVGVVQINVQVPSTLSTGTQQVVVTIGGVSSAPAQLQVTN
jgi:uncharacterized protein (TIGR03437 family)